MTNAPVQQFRMGAVKAVIWQNETQQGPRHNVTVARLYKDQQSGDWKESTSFGRDDLPLLVKVVDRAHEWIFQQAAQCKEEPAA